jgi:hypothetical protein
MKKVLCINDKNLPLGASVKEDQEYIVESEYVNGFDQKVYIIKGVPNEGTTKMGMRWMGYNAQRFRLSEDIKMEEEKYEYALN